MRGARPPAPADTLEFADLVLDLRSREVTRSGRPIELTARLVVEKFGRDDWTDRL